MVTLEKFTFKTWGLFVTPPPNLKITFLIIYQAIIVLQNKIQIKPHTTSGTHFYSHPFNFDWHLLLLIKLEKKMRVVFGLWIIYLEGRKHRVILNNTFVSKTIIIAAVTSSVRQGGHLSPLSFNCFINDT